MICDTYSDFNGDSGVHAVLVVQIDTVHVQPLQAALTRSSHVLWIASYRKPALLIDDVGELCCQLYLIPNPLNRLQKHTFSETPESYFPNAVGELNGTDLSDKDLVSVRSIHISSIQECDASVHSVPNEIDHLLLGPRRSIEGTHTHAAQSLLRDFQSLRPQLHSRHHGRHSHAFRSISQTPASSQSIAESAGVQVCLKENFVGWSGNCIVLYCELWSRRSELSFRLWACRQRRTCRQVQIHVDRREDVHACKKSGTPDRSIDRAAIPERILRDVTEMMTSSMSTNCIIYGNLLIGGQYSLCPIYIVQ